MASTLPEFVWVVHNYDNVLMATITKYHVHGETDHYWKVWLLGSDYKVKKTAPGTKVFISESVLRDFLQSQKQAQLEAAMRLVLNLSEEISVNIDEIPPDALKVDPDGIKLIDS